MAKKQLFGFALYWLGSKTQCAACATIVGATNFGVVAIDLTDLQAAIDHYRIASQNPRQAIISKSQAKKQIANMIREAIDDLLIAQLDKMVNRLKPTNRIFWDGYKRIKSRLKTVETVLKPLRLSEAV